MNFEDEVSEYNGKQTLMLASRARSRLGIDKTSDQRSKITCSAVGTASEARRRSPVGRAAEIKHQRFKTKDSYGQRQIRQNEIAFCSEIAACVLEIACFRGIISCNFMLLLFDIGCFHVNETAESH